MIGKKKKNHCCFRDKVKNCFGLKHCSQAVSKLSKHGRCGRVRVCKVTGDRKICAKMASMGVYPGVVADIICAHTGSQCILKVNGGTISLDEQVSDNIYVTNL
ncbi:FeoA family protein [Desulforhopalus singaporensis]|uniref:Fe2+ transport system protein FeoA n=1 Tax=Desulforhopalus singaporensis TaxID=91360 RepID=A0A1H0MS41_9BACT|nr:FeoA family protein [Desulforhopalus singaporensis]SDO83269.1 Fe2+ transport system protein FeoA [Desulforhopalus singaporensis]